MKRTMFAHPENLWNIHTDFDATNRYGTKMSPCNQTVPLAESQYHVINATNPHGALDDGIENRLHVRGRTADDAEHLGSCGLVLQGLAQFRIPLLDFLEQSHVLDRNHGLIGESFQQLDLHRREGAHLHPTDHDRPNRNALTQQWSGKYAPNANPSGPRSWEIVLRLCCKVMNVNGSPVNYGSALYITPVRAPRFITFGNRDWSIRCRWPKNITIRPQNNRIACITEPGSALRDNIQHRLNVRRRTGDDA